MSVKKKKNVETLTPGTKTEERYRGRETRNKITNDSREGYETYILISLENHDRLGPK